MKFTESEHFWKKKSSILFWEKKPKKILKFKNRVYPSWFSDGKINIAYNCLETTKEKNKTALIYVDKFNHISSLNYQDLSRSVNSFSFLLKNYFKNTNISKLKGLIHSSASKESSISMLSCCKLSLFHSVIFEDLKYEAIKKRMYLIKPQIFITKNNNRIFINKLIKDLKKINNNNKFLIICFNKIKQKNKNLKYLSVENLIKSKYQKVNYNFVNGDRPSFCLFTSGSTGIPKGIVHSTGGYLLYSKYTCQKKFNLNKNSVILTGSDAGWINGHTYALYGPLSIGATSVLIEKPFNLTNINTLVKILKLLKVTILYLPVTILRLIKAYGFNDKINIKSLKTIGSMGEPLAPNVAKWFSNKFMNKNVNIVNTYFQTETGGIICSPTSSDKKIAPYGSVGKPLTNYLKVSLDQDDKKSEMIIKNSWPGCMINVINGIEVWKKYWTNKKYFRMFDICSKDKSNNFFIHGRTDDVINIRGHRIGSEEVESVLLKNNYVSECSAVSINDELEGKRFVIFIVSKSKILKSKIVNDELLKNFGSYAIPKNLYFVRELPKTRSGKILRRVLRDILEGKTLNSLGDLSTILNPTSVKDIFKCINKK